MLRDPDNNYRLPVLPDAYFELTYNAGTTIQARYLEVDMGTLTRERLRRKVRVRRRWRCQRSRQARARSA